MAGKSSVISFRISDAEKERIEAKASAKNLKINTYARELVTGFDPDVVAARSRAAITEQEQALESLANSVKTLKTDVQQVGKRLRSDISLVVAIVAVASLALLAVGAGVGYAVAVMIG
ncbi:plasmid mobilization protein [Halomonas sp. AOP42-D2-25]|uniref:plasmid mobilization protein n=1 Tax=Halomonas sp. AOP42-D2-25 TaxID=3457666 RepID=UPI004034CC70